MPPFVNATVNTKKRLSATEKTTDVSLPSPRRIFGTIKTPGLPIVAEKCPEPMPNSNPPLRRPGSVTEERQRRHHPPHDWLLVSLNDRVFMNAAPPALALNPVVAAILSATVWGEVPSGWLAAFLAGVITAAVINIGLHRIYVRRHDRVQAPARWSRLLMVGAGLNGAAWGVGLGGIVFQAESLTGLALPAIVLAGLAGAFVAGQSALMSSVAAFIAASFMPTIGGLIAGHGAAMAPLATLMAIYAVALSFFAYNNHRQAVEALTLRFQNEALLAELLAAEERLIGARDAAQAVNRAKSQFLAMMSHELRTPLNAILGFSDIIANEQFGPVGVPRYTDYARDIHESGRHLLDLVNDILDLSKVEAGHMEISKVPLDLTGAVDSVLRLLRIKAEEASVGLSVDLAPDARRVMGDRRAISQILFNLVVNAIKFTPAGGSVVVRSRRVDGNTVMLSIEDTGIGIEADDLERVLHPFEQADNSYTRAAGGTGLGLPLARSLAELHGGGLTLKSRPGKGTIVEVTLPAALPVDKT